MLDLLNVHPFLRATRMRHRWLTFRLSSLFKPRAVLRSSRRGIIHITTPGSSSVRLFVRLRLGSLPEESDRRRTYSEYPTPSIHAFTPVFV